MSLRLLVSIESATRLSLRMLRILRCSGRWAATISSLSRPTHTTVTCGLPSGFSVTRWARPADSRTARPVLPEIAAGQYVDKRHQRDEVQDAPGPLPAAAHVSAGRQVDPHEDDRDRVQEADQQLEDLLHRSESTRAGICAGQGGMGFGR